MAWARRGQVLVVNNAGISADTVGYTVHPVRRTPIQCKIVNGDMTCLPRGNNLRATPSFGRQDSRQGLGKGLILTKLERENYR